MTKRVNNAPAPEESDPRFMRRVKVGDTSIELEVFIHDDEISDLKPLLIVNSIDYPMPPTVTFCERMKSEGYQVVFVRRPGFGYARALPGTLMTKREIKNLAPVAAEAALLKLLIDKLELKHVTVMGLGTANSICLRLAQLSPEVEFTVFANPLFHPAIWDVIRPPWLKRMIRQTVMSKSGLMIAVRGLRAVLRRDPIWFYKQFAQKSAGDLRLLDENPKDFKAAGDLLNRMRPEVFFYDLKTALVEDTEWSPESCARINAAILSGVESTENWKRSIVKEADRLGLPITFAQSGDLFVPYASPDTLLDVFRAHTRSAAVL